MVPLILGSPHVVDRMLADAEASLEAALGESGALGLTTTSLPDRSP